MERVFRFFVMGVLALSVVGCTVTADVEREVILETVKGEATFYASMFEGDTTASGRRFSNRRPIAAHRTYPFGTVVRVTNLRNGRKANVVILDRGPFGKNHREGVIIDLSRSTAEHLGFIDAGQVEVTLDVLAWGNADRRRRN